MKMFGRMNVGGDMTERGRAQTAVGGKSWGARAVWAAVASGCLALAGAAGYLLGAILPSQSLILSSRSSIPLEYYVIEESFSEIENTKARLAALRSQFLTELRARHDIAVMAPEATGLAKAAYGLHPETALQELENAIAEFRDTPEEAALVRELLCVLRWTGARDRWLDVYLGFLYGHPTDPMIGSLAKDAIEISRAMQREKEMCDAFQWIVRNPLEFPAKQRVLAECPGAPGQTPEDRVRASVIRGSASRPCKANCQ
jgi:hypothetical protein